MATPLSPGQIKGLSLALDQLQDELQQLLDATEAGTQPVKLKDNQGRLSRMDELHIQSILKANRTVTQKRLRAVGAAIIRVDDGSYGYCTTCDEPIAFKRLQAYPEAAMCIECQSDTESH